MPAKQKPPIYLATFAHDASMAQPRVKSLMRFLLFFVFVALPFHSASAQWMLLQSNVKANLDAIHNVGDGVVWASGDQGTVVRTTDDGKTWRPCALPADSEMLEFRGIQAFDENTAIVMSSGLGDLSRIYKTEDGCVSWKRVFINPDAPKGSFKAIQFAHLNGRDKGRVGYLVGDPVGGHFAEFRTFDFGITWTKPNGPWRAGSKRGEIVSAASNSALMEIRNAPLFVTSGKVSRSRTLEEYVKHDPSVRVSYVGGELPLRRGTSAGAVSVAAQLGPDFVGNEDASRYLVRAVHAGDILVSVGGDFQQPDNSGGNCAFSVDGSLHWSACETPPGGFRSAVAYDIDSQTWITVGPNGTDSSSDSGRNWRPIKPSGEEPRDGDKNWTALSLPFAVGPHGRIGKLRENAVKP